MIKCPACKAQAEKVLYAGIPARLCTDPACSTLFGPLSWLITLLPVNGVFFAYGGSYFKALLRWLFNDDEDWPYAD